MAQGEIETEREPDNFNENSFGIRLNSNGWGLDYRFSKRITYRTRYFYEIDYNYVKDPKEIKVINPYFETQKKFVYGKLLSFHQIRCGMGINRMVFEKKDKGSLSVHYQLSGGAVLGVGKPIYYQVVDSTQIIGTQQLFFTGIHRLNIDVHSPSDIINRAAYYYGLNELVLNPGIYFKAGIAFDFSKNVMRSNVLEAGTIIETYMLPVEIMAGNPRRVWWSIYLEYRFGKKYNAILSRDARKWAKKENR